MIIRENKIIDQFSSPKLQQIWAVYKSGTGTSGRVCGDLGTREEGLGEVQYGTRGRVGRGRGDVKCRDAGDAGCE